MCSLTMFTMKLVLIKVLEAFIDSSQVVQNIEDASPSSDKAMLVTVEGNESLQ